jgi:hypothetical protein
MAREAIARLCFWGQRLALASPMEAPVMGSASPTEVIGQSLAVTRAR